MRICAGIITWQDGEALDNCLESIRGVVDDVVIAEGLIDGIDPQGLPATDDEDGYQLTRFMPRAIRSQRWPSQSVMRQWTLNKARELGADWLLTIDADEQLCNPQALRPWLEVWRWEAFPLPFYFNDVQAVSCGFKLLHVPSWRRFVCQGNILEDQQGRLVQVIGRTVWTHAKEAGMPYLIHRPELRPLERQAIRLSELEVGLEPYPDGVQLWQEPVYTPQPVTLAETVAAVASGCEDPAVWYCPGCGRRFAGPGSCSSQHPAVALERVRVVT